MKVYIPYLASFFLVFAFGIQPGVAATKNGFVINDPLIPIDEIVSGGPPRDGIPAINQPKFVPASAASFMDAGDRVLGVIIDDVARAYPVKILDWHEVVNDQIGSQYFVVTYCPLCGSGMVFATNAAETRLLFGVSGLLYDSDVLLFDRNTESLWSQLMGKAVSGQLKGIELPQLPALHTTWADWRQRYPDAEVLSTDTGFRRNYSRSPYINYHKTRRLYFEVSKKAPGDLHTKELVLGVRTDEGTKAYPFSALEAHGKASFVDELGGRSLTIHWNGDAGTAWAVDGNGEVLPTTIAYWFAWYTFYPESLVFSSPVHQ
ncbi:MAG: DUF3179 domain-containing protein [Pseudomonadales bacterium]